MRALLAGLCFGLIATSALASSDNDPGSSSSRASKLPVEGRNGSFTRVIPIDIPAFRGIEPELRLVYDSTSGLRNLPAAGLNLGLAGLCRESPPSSAYRARPPRRLDRTSGQAGAVHPPMGRPALRLTASCSTKPNSSPARKCLLRRPPPPAQAPVARLQPSRAASKPICVFAKTFPATVGRSRSGTG